MRSGDLSIYPRQRTGRVLGRYRPRLRGCRSRPPILGRDWIHDGHAVTATNRYVSSTILVIRTALGVQTSNHHHVFEGYCWAVLN